MLASETVADRLLPHHHASVLMAYLNDHDTTTTTTTTTTITNDNNDNTRNNTNTHNHMYYDEVYVRIHIYLAVLHTFASLSYYVCLSHASSHVPAVCIIQSTGLMCSYITCMRLLSCSHANIWSWLDFYEKSMFSHEPLCTSPSISSGCASDWIVHLAFATGKSESSNWLTVFVLYWTYLTKQQEQHNAMK